MTTDGLFATTDEAIALGAYLTRIGYSGPREASPTVLRALHRLHPQVIAFENLDPLLGRLPVRLEVGSLMDKLVHGGRGGYCFEQNLLFGHLLSALGFHVSGLAARILWNQPEGAKTPRGHMLLNVRVDGENYIADVGFGALTLTAPLRLRPVLEQETPHERFRLIEQDGLFRLDARIGDEWRPVYSFDLQEQVQADYEITNYYLSSNPSSHFRTTLIAARPFAEGRYALLGNRLTMHALDAPPQRRMLSSVAELRDVLSSLFLIDVPDDRDSILASVIKPPTPGRTSAKERSR
ncbi:arylamine N-acetyltransferase family protein [Nitratireductor soli]|uniref:arylamine N-acetyltransferase family protein n=1 Tax=Nitratireductor soli TaxID=1670619 RepID=UPI00065E4A4D|nr:arylamine N-acetyltransferase [Nitratireductor soli]